jgi:V8-like Glu-specific endopeptidase
VLLKIRLSVVWAAAIMLLTVLACSAIALAITNGTPDGKKESDGSYTYPTDGSYTYKYPQVGALLDPKGFGDGTYTYCTGTLISPTVFLTAAHCDPLTGDELTFDAKYVAGSSKVYSICKGSTCTGDQPGDKYDGKFRADPSGNDIAVVVFGDPISGITPARLSSLHRFDTVAKDQGFTAVGYGGYKADNQAGGLLRSCMTTCAGMESPRSSRSTRPICASRRTRAAGAPVTGTLEARTSSGREPRRPTSSRASR